MNSKNRRVGECMRKLNNKGFAVTTLLYGTLILIFLSVFSIMAYMSANRSNTKKLTDEIKSELTSFGRKRARFSLVDNRKDADKKDTSHTSGTPYYVAASGNYFIQLFGAQGGDKDGYKGGKGAYTSGVISLDAGTTLYFHIGGQGDSYNCYTGIGGGGFTANCGNSAPGGGATYVRYGADADTIEEDNVIMVAAGGGGATISANGGAGGNLKGIDGSNSSGGGQERLLEWSEANKTFPDFLTGGSSTSTDSNAGAGGSGYYGGEAGKSENASGAGGSSYIAGYAGVGDIDESSSPYFINGVMIPGINTGAGYATITKVDSLSNITLNRDHIEACIKATGNSDNDIIYNVQAISKGKNVISSGPDDITDSTVTVGNYICRKYKINETAPQLSEILVRYGKSGELIPTSFKINAYFGIDVDEISSASNYYNLKKDQTDGIRYSLLDKITPDGAYYLISSTGKFYSNKEKKFVEFNKNNLQDYIIKFTDSSYTFDGNRNQIKVTGTGNSYYISRKLDGKVLSENNYFSVTTENEIDNDQEYQLKLVRVYE